MDKAMHKQLFFLAQKASAAKRIKNYSSVFCTYTSLTKIPRMKYLTACLLIAGMIAVSGCGRKNPADSGDTPGNKDEYAVSGNVRLPQACPLKLSDLQAVGYLDQSSVDAKGDFTVHQSAGGPAMTCLVDGADRLILFGYLDANNHDPGLIDAKSTAAGLLFRATGAFMLPPSSWKDALAIIDKSPQADTLAKVIEQQLVIQPAAIYEGNTAIETALGTAAGELIGKAPSATRVAASGNEKLAVETGASAPAQESESTLILVTPSARQSGVRVMPNPAGPGIVIQNDWRRHLLYFIYQTGHETKDCPRAGIPQLANAGQACIYSFHQ